MAAIPIELVDRMIAESGDIDLCVALDIKPRKLQINTEYLDCIFSQVQYGSGKYTRIHRNYSMITYITSLNPKMTHITEYRLNSRSESYTFCIILEYKLSSKFIHIHSIMDNKDNEGDDEGDDEGNDEDLKIKSVEYILSCYNVDTYKINDGDHTITENFDGSKWNTVQIEQERHAYEPRPFLTIISPYYIWDNTQLNILPCDTKILYHIPQYSDSIYRTQLDTEISE